MKPDSACNTSSDSQEAMNNINVAHDIMSETRSCSSMYPATPRKPAAHRLDYSSPRERYCRQPQLPPTPEPTPTKSVKRSAGHAFDDTSNYLSSTKRRHTDPEALSSNRSLFRRGSVPTFSILYQPPSPEPLDFSADELKRTCEAMLRQVDWDEVQQYVASNRSAATYKRALKSILQAEVDKLFEAEDDEESSE
ncbi:hypothetical protein MMC17_008288 [Xylographa soralifera]|nr:hypothetical protein [Xylographa soralifera]